MKASILDLRRKMKDVLKALDHNEPVTLTHRGKKKGIIYPSGGERHGDLKVAESEAFGMWKDHEDFRDVARSVRKIRKGRNSAL